MSENEEIKLFERIRENIANAQLLQRKVKLGESVVIADSNGKPLVVSAEEALRLFDSRHTVP